MKTADNHVNTVDERSNARMQFRIKPRVKATIHKAAALSGMDDSSFALNAAYRAALETISLYERTQLQAEDHAAFFAAIDTPPEPTEQLRTAFRRHNDRSVSR